MLFPAFIVFSFSTSIVLVRQPGEARRYPLNVRIQSQLEVQALAIRFARAAVRDDRSCVGFEPFDKFPYRRVNGLLPILDWLLDVVLLQW